jgi:DNA-binding CsgD family transcriptional regulator
MRESSGDTKKTVTSLFSPFFSKTKKQGDWLLEIFLGFMIFLSGIMFIEKIRNPPSSNISELTALLGYVGFFIFFIILFILIRNKKNSPMIRLILLFIYMLFCFFPFFSAGNVTACFVWIISFPFISVYFGGLRKGIFSSVFTAMLLGWFLKSAEMGMILQIYGAYFIILILTVLALKNLQDIQKNLKDKNEELTRFLSSQSRLNKSSDEEYRNLLKIMADVLEKKGEFFVFYRKDVLSTLLSLPQADAVLSYILLEGISNVNLFNSDKEKKNSPLHNMGEYIYVSGEFEDFFSKIDAVIELRKAKKSLEFNKIQTQMNRIFPSVQNDEKGEANLENLFEQYNLSEREIDIARCILKGLTNKEISLELYISIETVKTHVKNTLKKCGISSRIELIRLFSNSPPDLL